MRHGGGREPHGRPERGPAVQPAAGRAGTGPQADVLHLQRTIGNAGVGHLLRGGEGNGCIHLQRVSLNEWKKIADKGESSSRPAAKAAYELFTNNFGTGAPYEDWGVPWSDMLEEAGELVDLTVGREKAAGESAVVAKVLSVVNRHIERASKDAAAKRNPTVAPPAAPHVPARSPEAKLQAKRQRSQRDRQKQQEKQGKRAAADLSGQTNFNTGAKPAAVSAANLQPLLRSITPDNDLIKRIIKHDTPFLGATVTHGAVTQGDATKATYYVPLTVSVANSAANEVTAYKMEIHYHAHGGGSNPLHIKPLGDRANSTSNDVGMNNWLTGKSNLTSWKAAGDAIK